MLTELFSGNFNGNFIELKCTTLFFEGKTKQKKPRRAVYQFHVVCFDGNGCAWVGFSPEKKFKSHCVKKWHKAIEITNWLRNLKKVMDSKLSIENDINNNCATFHEILLNS